MPQTTTPTAESVTAEPEALLIRVAGRELRIAWADCSRRLAEASPEDRAAMELSPGGYGIHWPRIDEDLSVAGLVRDHGS